MKTKKEKEKSTWKSIRGVFNTIHLWLGVGSSLILFVVCLTGTIYTFAPEIQKITDSELYTVQVKPDATRLPAETVLAKVLASLNGGEVQTIVIPEAVNASYQLTIGKKEEKPREEKPKEENPKDERGEGKDAAKGAEAKQGGEKNAGPPQRPRGTTYFVNPYTAEILGTNETSSSAFFMFMFRAHRWLLLDTAIGRPIVGAATLIFVVIIISGLVIWFPKKIKNWRQGLKIKTSANWKRVNHDLHNALGLYAALFLLVMALTGLTWSFEWYKTGFNNTLGVKKKEEKKPESIVTPGATKASVENILAAADQALPYAGDYRIMLPQDSTGVVALSKTQNSFFATSVADRITLDQYSSAVLTKDLFSEKPLNEKISSSIKALHIGSFYGTLSKIVYFIACLIGTSLPVTGVMIWINKLRKKSSKIVEDSDAVVTRNPARI